jgi:hypothetical protein
MKMIRAAMRDVMVPPEAKARATQCAHSQSQRFLRLPLLIEKTCWRVVRELLVTCAPADATPVDIPVQSPERHHAATARRDFVPATHARQWRAGRCDAIIVR